MRSLQMHCTQRHLVRTPCGSRALRAAFKSNISIRLQPSRVVLARVGDVIDGGSYSVRGTVRKQNEDRFDLETNWGGSGIAAAAAVYDGHGGVAVAEWLQSNFFQVVVDAWNSAPEKDVAQAFITADEILLRPKSGFFGAFGERGVGGSKCGATCALALVIEGKDGSRKLLSANAGDARVILARGGRGVQLSEDHTPDVEAERKRIERTNPNPKMPLVRYVGNTWRVGGVLALSRAFGDAYLKGSAQFEGVPAGSDGYSSGFGLTADPHITVEDIKDSDTWIIVCSDGLCGNIERGAGGGLTNDQIAALADEVGKKGSAEDVAAKLAAKAQEVGSTDDVTVVALKLGK